MAFVDITAHSSSVTAQVAVRLADRFVALARGAVYAETANRADDDVFTPRRLKSSRLPEIEACQTTIFRELRHREEMLGHLAGADRAETDELRRTGLNVRIGRLFGTH